MFKIFTLLIAMFVVSTAAYAEPPTPLGSTQVWLTLQQALDSTGRWRRFLVAPGSEVQVRSDLGVTSSSSPVFTGATTITPSLTITGSSTSSADTAFKINNSIATILDVTNNKIATFYGGIRSYAALAYIVIQNTNYVYEQTAELRFGQVSGEALGGKILSRLKSDTTSDLELYPYNSGAVLAMILKASGNIGIGTTTPATQLHVVGTHTVNGNIVVNGSTINVPDYVFASDYKLLPIEELKEYVEINQHLPEFESAKDTTQLNLVQDNMRLREAVEKLTLYLIDMKQEIADLRGRKKIQ